MKLEGEKASWMPPKWTHPFKPIRFQQGSQVMFEGVVTGNPTPDVKWTWKNQRLESYSGKAGKGKMTSFDPANGRVTLMLSDVGPGDEGIYTCTASNPYGESTCSINLNPEKTQSRRKPTLPKGSCRTKLKACHIDSDDYADYAKLKGL